MRSIAMINQKGGVGKTTTAVQVAAALADAGQRVLLLDLDPQAHATLHLGVELADTDPTVYDILVRGAAVAETVQTAGGIIVIPSHVDLVGAEVELAQRDGRETVLRRALGPYQECFDFCVMDCGPSLGLLTVNALALAHEVIIPLQPHFLALQGLGRLLETVTLVRQGLNPTLRISGVVLCMFEKGTRLAQEVRNDVEVFVAAAQPEDPWCGAVVFNTPIRRNIKLAECPSFGQTVFQYAPSSHGAEDYRSLAAEILALGNGGPEVSVAAPVSKPAEEVLPDGAENVVSPPADEAPRRAETPAASGETA
jgi:chromosome partitioning protein